MRVFRTLALAICAWLALAPAARAEVHVSLRNGRVTIIAKDATVRQILVEWARVGKTRVVNVERIPGGPLTLELKDVSEADALDVLLRTLSGYIAAPRLTTAAADLSAYDSIVVMPTTAAVPARTSGPANAPAPFAPPTFSQNDDENENGPARPGGAQPRPGIFTTFPQPQVGNGNGGNGNGRPMLPVVRPGIVSQPRNPNANEGNQQQPEPPLSLPQAPARAAPSASPGGSAGVSAPGMISPSPASQPGQVAPPQRPNGE